MEITIYLLYLSHIINYKGNVPEWCGSVLGDISPHISLKHQEGARRDLLHDLPKCGHCPINLLWFAGGCVGVFHFFCCMHLLFSN